MLFKIVWWMWELKLTALALLLKQPGKLFRENKNLNASQPCKCWNIAELWSELHSSNLTETSITSLAYVFSITSGTCQFVNHMRFKIHRVWIFVRAKLWKFLSLIENFKTNRLLNSYLAWIYLHIGTLIKIKRGKLNFKTYPYLHKVLPLYQSYRYCDCFQILNRDGTFDSMDSLF